MSTLNSWIRAARLRTLPLSLSGVILGGLLAAAQKAFDPLILGLSMLTTIGFQVVSNFANDYGDGVKGTDNAFRVGPERALQSGAISPSAMKRAIQGTSLLTLFVALILIYVSFGLEHWPYAIIFILFGLGSIYAAVKYTVGDNAYGYSGFGDLFVFVFFGLLSVCGSYFLYTLKLDLTVFLPAFSVGALSVGVLNLNNMRDRESDLKSGKNTLVVKIGPEFARYYHYYLLGSSFLFALLYVGLHYRSAWQFLFVFAFLPIFKHMHTVYRTEDPKELDPELKKLALSTFLFSLLFGLGMLFS